MPEGFPARTYLICATHRCGSNLLCQALWHTESAGYPQEAFSPTRSPLIAAEHGVTYDPEKQFSCYVEALMRLRQTKNGVFGAKIMWKQVSWLVGRLRADPAWAGPADGMLPGIFASVFPNLSFIWMRRRDKVRQAISLVKAKQTKIYNSMQADAGAVPGKVAYDFAAIDREVKRLHEDDAGWENFFLQAGIDPFRVIYEDFVQNYHATIRDLLRFLGQTLPDEFIAPDTNYHRLANGVNDEWYDRFIADERVS